MANFNKSFVDVTKFKESDLMNAGMTLLSFLSDEEYSKLRKDWDENGGYEKIHLWKYALDNIEVLYR